MAESLKKQTFHGVIWSAAERFSLQGVQFLIGIIMARLLTPDDYGLIGMLAVFMSISQVFIDGGMSVALVQLKERKESDFSTAFFLNLSISIAFYLILFFSAPLIARFFNQPLLEGITKVYTLCLVINSLAAVNKTKLTIAVDFKTLAKISVTSAIISGVIGIYFAYTGLGVWALVIQAIVSAVFMTLLSFFYVRWIPHFSLFTKDSFKSLFGFGSKLLIAQLISQVYTNLYSLAIGKKFIAASLGYYTRANQFTTLVSNNLTDILARVSLPVLSKVQDDDEQLVGIYSRYLKSAVFVVFPLVLGLCGVAKPLILVLLTDKWADSILLLQILCIGQLTTVVTQVNLNLLYVKGRSDLVLKLEIAKKSVAFLILVLTIIFCDIIGVCIGLTLYSYIAVCMNTYYTKKLLNYGLMDQIKDIFPYLALSVLILSECLFITCFIENSYISLTLSLVISVITYTAISYFTKLEGFTELLNMIHKK